ncbi:MAG: C-terminal binding protein [Thermoflexales bacterium]|nr:C-terminal binding protein [Thermoflexales bacterium]
MNGLSDLSDVRIVRLNAELHPVTECEARCYAQYRLSPLFVEAHTPEEAVRQVAGADAVFVVSAYLQEPVIAAMDRCRVIARMGTGVDKIDIAAATRAGIVVANVPFFCVEEQADHAMALLLALVRKLPQMDRCLRAGTWTEARDLMRTNQRVPGRVLGLVGFGNSAQAMARRARGFGMRVLANRRNPQAARAVAAEIGVELVDLPTLLAQSDYVSLHLPLSAETYHLFDAATLYRMKRGAILINTSRGAIVDEAALAAALQEGHLGGAGIDTFEGIDFFAGVEGPPEHPLLALDNVIVTPHVAAGSVQAMEDVARGSVENVVCVLRGHWPQPAHVVNADVQPRRFLADYDPGLLMQTS